MDYGSAVGLRDIESMFVLADVKAHNHHRNHPDASEITGREIAER